MLSPVRSTHIASGLLLARIRLGGVSVNTSGALTGIGRGVMLNVHGASEATGVITGSAQVVRFKLQGGGVICVVSGSPVTRFINRSL